MKWDQISSQLFPNDIHDFSSTMNQNQDIQYFSPPSPSPSPSNTTSTAARKKPKPKKKNKHSKTNSTISSSLKQQPGPSTCNGVDEHTYDNGNTNENPILPVTPTRAAPRQNLDTDTVSNASFGSKNSQSPRQHRRAGGGRKQRSKLQISSEQGGLPEEEERSEQLYQEPGEETHTQTPKRKKNKNKKAKAKQDESAPSEKGLKKGRKQKTNDEGSDTGIKAFSIQKADTSDARPIGASIEVVDRDSPVPENEVEDGAGAKKKKNKKKKNKGKVKQVDEEDEGVSLAQYQGYENKEVQGAASQAHDTPVQQRKRSIPTSTQGHTPTRKNPHGASPDVKEPAYQPEEAEVEEDEEEDSEDESDESDEEEEEEEDKAASSKKPIAQSNGKEVRIKLDLNLEMEILLKTKIKGEIMITFM